MKQRLLALVVSWLILGSLGARAEEILPGIVATPSRQRLSPRVLAVGTNPGGGETVPTKHRLVCSVRDRDGGTPEVEVELWDLTDRTQPTRLVVGRIAQGRLDLELPPGRRILALPYRVEGDIRGEVLLSPWIYQTAPVGSDSP